MIATPSVQTRLRRRMAPALKEILAALGLCGWSWEWEYNRVEDELVVCAIGPAPLELRTAWRARLGHGDGPAGRLLGQGTIEDLYGNRLNKRAALRIIETNPVVTR